MLLSHNTRNTGHNAIKMSQAFHDIARFKRFTQLNQFNVHSMSFTGTRMLYNILFVGAYFSIAVIVDGDESSLQRLLLVFVLVNKKQKFNKLIAPFCRKKAEIRKSQNK